VYQKLSDELGCKWNGSEWKNGKQRMHPVRYLRG
jgi:hypothetical protein